MNLFKKLSRKIQVITNYIFLHSAYFIGIGISSITAKTIGKHFLEMKVKKTSWQKHTESKNLKKMY